MGKIITLSTNLIRPTQDYLLGIKLDTLISDIEAEKITPPAIRFINGIAYVLDGHHLLSLQNKTRGKAKIYVAKCPDDLMNISMFPSARPETIEDRNELISHRFYMVESGARTVQRQGIYTFEDLWNKNRKNTKPFDSILTLV